MKRPRRRRTRAEIRAERDLEIADFVDGFADLAERKRAAGDGQEGGPIAMLRGLASSIRAGLVD